MIILELKAACEWATHKYNEISGPFPRESKPSDSAVAKAKTDMENMRRIYDSQIRNFIDVQIKIWGPTLGLADTETKTTK